MIKLYNFGEGNKNFRGKQSWESNNKMRGVGVLKRVARAGLTERMIMEQKLATQVSEGPEVRVCLECSRNVKAISAPEGQNGAGQKGNRSDCIGLAVDRKISGSVIREGSKKEKGINSYWAPPTCLAVYIYHLTGSSQRSEEGISLFCGAGEDS